MTFSTSLRASLLSASTLALILLSGCGDDPVSAVPDAAPPGVGSIYRLAAPRETGSIIDTLTVRVTGTGETIYGRNNVVTVDSRISTNPDDPNPIFMTYESNGDLSIHIEGQKSTHSGVGYFTSPSAWVTYPFGSGKAETEVVKFDTGGTISGRNVGFSVRHTVQYLGTEDLTVKGEKLTTHKVVEKIVRTDTETNPDNSYTAEYTTTYWYSPKTRFMARMTFKRTDDGGNLDQSQNDLIDYTLK